MHWRKSGSHSLRDSVSAHDKSMFFTAQRRKYKVERHTIDFCKLRGNCFHMRGINFGRIIEADRLLKVALAARAIVDYLQTQGAATCFKCALSSRLDLLDLFCQAPRFYNDAEIFF